MKSTKTSSLSAARAELRKLADPARAKSTSAFFKCGPGEYGEGDVFLGISVPNLRVVARACDIAEHQSDRMDAAGGSLMLQR